MSLRFSIVASLCIGVMALATPVLAMVAEPLPARTSTAPIAKPTPAPFYAQTNLTSNGGKMAKVTDRHLINAWGMTFAPNTFIWISDNNAGVSTLYSANGQITPLVVKIPLPPGKKGTSAPTGIIFNSNLSEFAGGLFVFSTEDGTIAKWSDGTRAELAVDNSGSGAVYKGLALGTNASGDKLYATNFHAGTVDVFDRNFAPAVAPGGFVDPSIPSGFAPFGIANINGDLYVSYAMQDADKVNDLPGVGLGFVDIFDTNGNLIKRLVSQGPLNAPWGMAIAPADFGPLSNALLIGNFGDGAINAFNAASGALIGPPRNSKGSPIVIDGLWSLVFGDGSDGRPRNTLFFTAGPKKESAGLFGTIQAHVPAVRKQQPPTGTCVSCHG